MRILGQDAQALWWCETLINWRETLIANWYEDTLGCAPCYPAREQVPYNSRYIQKSRSSAEERSSSISSRGDFSLFNRL
jgi:hypothetical protein